MDIECQMNSILEYIYQTYYETDGPIEEAAYVSSHWKEVSQHLLFQRDISGQIVPSPNYDWGCRWKSQIGRGFDTIHKFVHVPSLTHKRRIFKLSALAARLCKRMGLDPTFNVFRQVCTVELLERHVHRCTPDDRLRILVIGDGTGVLAALLKEVHPTSSICLVDIGKALLFQAYHCQRAHPDKVHRLAGEDSDVSQFDFLYCPTESLQALAKCDFDIAVNVASMQEMNTVTIARYFEFMRSRLRPNNLFYCCNRKSKTLVGGELSEFYKYPWIPSDNVLLEGECPWHRYIVGRSTSNLGPKILGFPIPFLRYYDGIMVHRLAVLKI